MNYIDKHFFIKNKMQSFVKSELVENILHIYMYGFISREDINSADVINEIGNKIDAASQVILHLNSDGGDVKEGLSIYDFLSRYSEKLTVIVEGGACSIASIIALAGKSLKMTPNSLYMIHLPFFENISGNSQDLIALTDLLGKVEERLVNIYSEKLKKPAEEIFAKMLKESWFSATEAYEYGISDGIFSGRTEILPINIMNCSKLDTDELKNILISKRLKELKNMNAKHKEEILKIKAEMQEVQEMVNEITEEEKPVEEVAPVAEAEAPVIEEEKPVAEMTEEAPKEEMVAEEEIEVETEPTIDPELLKEVVSILSDEEGNIASDDLMAVLEEKDPMCALRKAGSLCKARLMNKLKLTVNAKRSDFSQINNTVKNNSNVTDGSFKRINFAGLPKKTI